MEVLRQENRDSETRHEAAQQWSAATKPAEAGFAKQAEPHGRRAAPSVTAAEVHEVACLIAWMRPNRLKQIVPERFGSSETWAQDAAMSAFLLQTVATEGDIEAQWRERTVAAWALGRAPLTGKQRAQAADALSALLENRTTPQQKRWRGRAFRAVLRTAGVSILTTFLLGMAVLAGMLFQEPCTNPLQALLALLLCSPVALLASILFSLSLLFLTYPIGFSLSAAVDKRRGNRTRAQAATSLERIAEPRTIGALALGMLDRDKRVSARSETALLAVVPLLEPKHYGALPGETVAHLCRALENKSDWAFTPEEDATVIALLDALAVVGDGQAVRVVERIAENASVSAVRKVAARVLPILQERQERERERSILLRGATPPVASAGELLRPAQDSAMPPEQHLRPASAPAE